MVLEFGETVGNLLRKLNCRRVAQQTRHWMKIQKNGVRRLKETLC